MENNHTSTPIDDSPIGPTTNAVVHSNLQPRIEHCANAVHTLTQELWPINIKQKQTVDDITDRITD